MKQQLSLVYVECMALFELLLQCLQFLVYETTLYSYTVCLLINARILVQLASYVSVVLYKDDGQS